MQRFTTTIARLSAYTYSMSMLLVAATVYGAPTYTPLTGIPGITDQGGTRTLPEYMNAIYLLIITIGALFGVVKIAIAGVKYSMSDVVSSKQSAKDDIKNVLLGLAVLLIPFMVLNTINPNLTKLDVLQAGKDMVNLNVSTKYGAAGTQSITTQDNQTSNCTAHSIIDYKCNNICVPKGSVQGAACGKENEKLSTTGNCSNFSYNSSLPDCASVCTSLKGTFDSKNMNCTYGK